MKLHALIRLLFLPYLYIEGKSSSTEPTWDEVMGLNVTQTLTWEDVITLEAQIKMQEMNLGAWFTSTCKYDKFDSPLIFRGCAAAT
jgi:hypothetical protein